MSSQDTKSPGRSSSRLARFLEENPDQQPNAVKPPIAVLSPPVTQKKKRRRTDNPETGEMVEIRVYAPKKGEDKLFVLPFLFREKIRKRYTKGYSLLLSLEYTVKHLEAIPPITCQVHNQEDILRYIEYSYVITILKQLAKEYGNITIKEVITLLNK